MEQSKQFKNEANQALTKAEASMRAATAQTLLFEQGAIKHLIKTCADMICTFEMDSGYLVSVNDTWTEVLGWSEEELLAKPFFDFIHPNDRERTTEVYVNLSKGERANSALFTNKYLHKDGHYVELQWNVGKSISFGNYGMNVARPLSTMVTDNKIRPCIISTVFEGNENQSDEPMIVGPEFSRLFNGMICRDLAPKSVGFHIWQCMTEANTIDPMGWHRHPDQEEDIEVYSGKLMIEVQVFTLLQRLGLKSKLERLKSKVVILTEGSKFKSRLNLWHRVLPSDEGANFVVEWRPKKYSD